MNVLKYVMLVTFFLSGASMIVFVLLHSGRGSGLSSAFGASSFVGLSGTQIVQRTLDRITIGSALVFIISTIVLIYIYK